MNAYYKNKLVKIYKLNLIVIILMYLIQNVVGVNIVVHVLYNNMIMVAICILQKHHAHHKILIIQIMNVIGIKIFVKKE